MASFYLILTIDERIQTLHLNTVRTFHVPVVVDFAGKGAHYCLQGAKEECFEQTKKRGGQSVDNVPFR